MIVEREVMIEAPAEVVWSVVTEPEQVCQWFADEAVFEAKPGAEGAFVFKNPPMTVPLRVEQVRPPELFSFRWVYPDAAEPGPENSVLVEFTLQSEGDATRLRVVESGFDKLDWPEKEKLDYIAEHTEGWREHLGEMRTYAPKLRLTRL